MPFKVAAIEIHDSPDGMIYVYRMMRDNIQEHLLHQEWHDRHGLHGCLNCSDHPEISPGWVAMEMPSLATRSPLPLGVGDYYTVDLVPWKPYKVPDELLERPTLADFLRKLMGE